MTSRVWNLATYMMMPHLARSLLWNMREHLKRGEVKIIGMSPRGCRMRRTVDVFLCFGILFSSPSIYKKQCVLMWKFRSSGHSSAWCGWCRVAASVSGSDRVPIK